MAASENEAAKQAEGVVEGQDAKAPAGAEAVELSEAQAALAGIFQQLNNVSAELTNEMRALGRLGRQPPDTILQQLPRRLAGTTLKLCIDGFKHVANLAVLVSMVEGRVEEIEEAGDLNAVASPDELFGFLHDVLELCTIAEPYLITEENKAALQQVREQAEEFLSRMSEDEDETEDASDEEAEGDEDGGKGGEPEGEEPEEEQEGKEGPDAS